MPIGPEIISNNKKTVESYKKDRFDADVKEMCETMCQYIDDALSSADIKTNSKQVTLSFNNFAYSCITSNRKIFDAAIIMINEKYIKVGWSRFECNTSHDDRYSGSLKIRLYV